MPISCMAAAGRRWRMGADVLKTMRNINVGLAGFVEAAGSQGLGAGADDFVRPPVLRRM